MCFSIAFFSICVSRLLQNSFSFQMDYSQIPRTQHEKCDVLGLHYRIELQGVLA